MATSLSISKKFVNPIGNIVANATQIAYEEEVVTNGAISYDRTKVSIKDKIDALLQSINSNTADIGTIQGAITQIQSTLSNLDLDAANVVYSEGVSVADKIGQILTAINGLNANTLEYGSGVSVKDKIDEINTTLQGLNPTQIANSVTTAQNAANQAVSANNNLTNGYYVFENGTLAATYNATIQKYTSDGTTTGTEVINNQLGGVDVIFIKGVQTVASEYTQSVEEVKSIAQALATNFDADANFKIIPNEQYKNKLKNNTLDPATIYFCYEGKAAAEDLLYDVTLVGVSDKGVVKIACGNEFIQLQAVGTQTLKALNYNSTLLFTLTPVNDYRVKSIKVSTNGGAYQNVDKNSTSLKVTGDLMIQVDFELIPIYTATFLVDGVTYGTVESYIEGATIVFPADPEKSGYTFIGWDNDTTIMPASNQTYNAQFEEVQL